MSEKVVELYEARLAEKDGQLEGKDKEIERLLQQATGLKETIAF